MKVKALLTFFILMSNLYVMAQNQDWEVHIGLSNKAEASTDLIEYYDKGYYIEGKIGGGSGWQIKTDINGNILWDEYLDHNSYLLQGWSVAMDDEGNRYVAGVKFNFGTWSFVSKFNNCGEEVWCRILVDDEFNSGGAIDIIVNENSEIIILSNYDSELEIEMIFLECLSTDGDVLWKKGYASKNDYPWIAEPIAYDLMEFNKEYYISGYCYWPYPNDTNHVYLRPLFIGIDSLFNEKWILPFYALDSVFGDAFYSIPVNDSIIMGVGDRRTFGLEYYSLLMFYNTDGQEIGFSQINNDQIGSNIISNDMREVVKINDTTYIATGFYEPVYTNHYVVDFKTDTSANLINFQLRPDVTGIPSLISTSDNNYAVASRIKEANNDYNIYFYKIDENLEMVPFDTNPYTYDSLCPEPIQSGTIDLSDCLVWTGTEEIPSPEEYYSFIATIPIIAYPNPAETEITLAFENTEHHNNMLLECYNIYGQKVHSEKIYKGQQQTKLSVINWSKGLFFAVVKSNGSIAGQVRFVVKGK